MFTVLEHIFVNARGNNRKFRNQIVSIFKGVIPILSLADTVRICFCKARFMLKRIDGKRELRHWMQSLGTSIQDIFNIVRNSRPSSPISRQLFYLSICWHLASDKQPKQSFRQRLLAALNLWQKLL